jgi:tetratricopeptide (TPR) repeat protein
MDPEPEDLDQSAAADHHLRQAYLYEEQEEYEKALSECDAAVAITQSFLADAHNLRGVVLEELGRNKEAIEAYNAALLIEPGFREAADNLLELEHELGIKHKLVTIATFSQAVEAHIPRARLEAEGIWAFVADEGIVTMNWLYSNVVGGVKLQVKEQDVDRAVKILGIEMEDAEFYEDEFDDEEESRCPNCNSLDIHYERYSKRGVFASWLILRFPLPFLKRKWKCRKCGFEWKEGARRRHLNDLITLEKMVTSHPSDVGYVYELADAYADQERWEDAIEAYRTAITLDPSNADLHNSLGVTYEAVDRMNEAEQVYQQAIQLRPDDSMFYYNLGTLYEKQRRIAQAVQTYRKCLQYSSDPEEHTEVKGRLSRLEGEGGR